jgi:RIO-like serine/threonine protein kinase
MARSEISNRKEDFRKRLKANTSFSIVSFKSNHLDNESSASGFIKKLQGFNSEQDIISQKEQEELFQNKFEKQYVKLEKLGEGCSSEVLKCKHKILNQLRAAKIIRNDDDEYIEISKREFTLLKPLNHPNIVKVYDCIHDEQKAMLVLIMEYIPGLTLEDYVLKMSGDRIQLPEAEIIYILSQLAKAVQYLHKNGICHRDLKPDNVLINPKTK